MSPQVGEVSAGVAARRALVGLLARVHAHVAFEVVEVRGRVEAVQAAVGFLLRVGVGVAGQVVGVVGQEGAVRAAVQIGATLTTPGSPRHGRAARRPGSIFGEQIQRATTTHLSSVALPLPLGLVALQVGLLQGEATHPAAQGEEEDGERGRGRAEAPKRLEVT